MKFLMPQEIEVWYLIPALRREIAKNLIKEHGLTQKEVANILGATEATISQYLSAKRAQEIQFSPKEEKYIRETSKKIVKDTTKAVSTLYELSSKFRTSKTFCDFHKKSNKSIPRDCSICRQKS